MSGLRHDDLARLTTVKLLVLRNEIAAELIRRRHDLDPRQIDRIAQLRRQAAANRDELTRLIAEAEELEARIAEIEQ